MKVDMKSECMKGSQLSMLPLRPVEAHEEGAEDETDWLPDCLSFETRTHCASLAGLNLTM